MERWAHNRRWSRTLGGNEAVRRAEEVKETSSTLGSIKPLVEFNDKSGGQGLGDSGSVVGQS